MATLLDKDGSPLVPTLVPPSIEFDDLDQKAGNTQGALAGDESGSKASNEYFPIMDAPQTNGTAESDNTTKAERATDTSAAPQDTATAPKPLPRLDSAPVPHTRPSVPKKAMTDLRPKARGGRTFLRGNRSKTNAPNTELRRALQRSATGTHWKYMSDDSSSSSSDSDSEDERPPVRRARTAAGEEVKQPPPVKRTQTGAEKKESQARKQDRADRNAFGRFKVGNDQFQTRGRVSKRDGRLNISVNETTNNGYLAKALGAGIRHHFIHGPRHEVHNEIPESPEEEDVVVPDPETPGLMKRAATAMSITPSVYKSAQYPKLNIVVIVIGSRGDIQPFIKIGKLLQEYGHRVRIATHPAFRKFVSQDSGLEFFSVGGDPSELMAFMVKNPGLIPSVETVKAGEIGRRRAAMYQMFQGMWRACINATDDESNEENTKMMAENNPFVADAMIANPPGMAHVHICERLGIPLHMMFTFPYTPTTAFPHPLANIKRSNVDANYTNFMSYPLVEMMTWQGLGDLVNKFRVNTLGLEPVSTLWAPGQLYRLKVPYTYMWSPGLVPKPSDWGPEIDIAGFVFLELASSFKPPEDLVKFLEAGEPPVYIGFGSIVVDDPNAFTEMIFEAVKLAGVRALVSKGWGGLGGNDNTPDNIFMLENTPHDWLFPKVRAVVHHGGAGTTAIGLKCGKPTMIVPFFGDQPFWGAMVANAKAGAFECIPYKKLTADLLAEGIKQCLTEEAQENVNKIAESIAAEGDGAANAVKSFHRSLPLRGEHSMRCSVLVDRVAVWRTKKGDLRLSALAAELLVETRKLRWNDMRLVRHYEWNDFDGPGEPITGATMAVVRTAVGTAKGVGKMPVEMARHIKRRKRHEEKKQAYEAKYKRSASEATKKAKEVQQKQESNRAVADPGTGEKMRSSAYPDEEKRINEGHESSSTTLAESKIQATDYAAGQGAEKRISLPNNTQSNAHLSDALEKATSPKLSNGVPRQPTHRTQTEQSMISALSADPEEDLAEELAEDAKHGFLSTGAAVAKAPMDITLAVAQGFHNAPRLYGDDTVRRPIRINGFHSGLRAAGDEFRYGIYDGVTGLVMQPYHGAKQEGVVGCLKGVGKGIGGFVLKDLAAIIGPFGYTMKGIHKEMQKRHQPTHFIRKARVVQGQNDAKHLRGQERDKVIEAVGSAWRTVNEIWKQEERLKKGHGIKGIVQVQKERKHWRRHGATENIAQADKALQAQKEGKDFDTVFKKQREELRRAGQPREPAMERYPDNGVGVDSGAGIGREAREKDNGDGRERLLSGDDSHLNGTASINKVADGGPHVKDYPEGAVDGQSQNAHPRGIAAPLLHTYKATLKT